MYVLLKNVAVFKVWVGVFDIVIEISLVRLQTPSFIGVFSALISSSVQGVFTSPFARRHMITCGINRLRLSAIVEWSSTRQEANRIVIEKVYWRVNCIKFQHRRGFYNDPVSGEFLVLASRKL